MGFDTSYGSAGVFYEGIFPGGNNHGKIVIMGFPFETIYPTEIRNTFMNELLDFFFDVTDINLGYEDNLPTQFLLFQNYPNPFNPTTTIKYTIPSTSVISNPLEGERSQDLNNIEIFPSGRNDLLEVNLSVFDVLGRKVETLVNRPQNPGTYQVDFNASSLSNGVYYYRLTFGTFTKTMKMIVLK